MASIKLFFRESSVALQPGSLFFRILHRRSVAILNPSIKIMTDEWNKAEAKVIGNRSKVLMEEIQIIKSRLDDIVMLLDRKGNEYCARDVIELYYKNDITEGFVSLGRTLIKESIENNNHSAAEHLTTVINNFSAFIGADDIDLDKIDSVLMGRYELYLKQRNLCQNSTSYYMRKLRAIYNIAVEKELTTQRFPFKHVYTGIAKTVKRALSLADLKRLKELRLDSSIHDKFARDMFLFSFYTRGMAPVDMAFLKKNDLQQGLLTYRRKKTGQLISIRWERAMQEIVDFYTDKDSSYLLPLIREGKGEERRQYLNSSHLLNRYLKNIGKRLGLSQPLTMYVARHSWASVAREIDIPLSVISQGMGHDSESTTLIYLDSIDRSKIDKANSSIMSLLDK